jgi:hypothetical protein
MATRDLTERTGFPELASRIAVNPDYEAFIFRKFDRLSARNLLHLESKLAYLEWKLDQADEQALHSPDNETHRSIRAWEAFEENAKNDTRPEQAWMIIAEDIRETLKEYRKICSSSGIYHSANIRRDTAASKSNSNPRGTQETGPRSRTRSVL